MKIVRQITTKEQLNDILICNCDWFESSVNVSLRSADQALPLSNTEREAMLHCIYCRCTTAELLLNGCCLKKKTHKQYVYTMNIYE